MARAELQTCSVACMHKSCMAGSSYGLSMQLTEGRSAWDLTQAASSKKKTQGLNAIEFDKDLAGITSNDVPGLPLDGGFSILQTLA